jgi:hypothetical protein
VKWNKNINFPTDHAPCQNNTPEKLSLDFSLIVAVAQIDQRGISSIYCRTEEEVLCRWCHPSAGSIWNNNNNKNRRGEERKIASGRV